MRIAEIRILVLALICFAGLWALDVLPVQAQGNPNASFTLTPSSVTVGQTINLDASGSTASGAILSYAWSFGDGTTGSGSTSSHIFVDAGTYTIVLVISDSIGNTGVATATITVSPNTIAGSHASLFAWGVRPQWKKFSIVKQGPVEPVQAFGINDGSQTEWAYVQFKVTGDAGVSRTLYTQVVQLTQGMEINGNTDPRFAANWSPTIPGSYTVQATIFYSTASVLPPIGDSSFVPNVTGTRFANLLVLP